MLPQQVRLLFGSLEKDKKAIDHAGFWEIKKDDIDTVILATDGLTEYYNEMEISDMESFFYLMKLNGDYVFDNLRTIQNEDKELNKIRFKVSDDATGIVIKFD